MSKGEILAWLNADDVWEVPDAVRRAVTYLQAHPEVDVVYGDCGSIDAGGNLRGMSYLHEWDLEYAVEHCDHCIPQPAAFIRRAILERVGWLDTNLIIMDRDLWYRIGLIGTIRHMPVLLAYARDHPSYWHSKSQLVAANCVQIIRKFFRTPDLPPRFHLMKRRAVSNSYVRGMQYAWIGRHWKTIVAYALRAVLADPTNARTAASHLKGYAAGSAEECGTAWWLNMGLELLNFPRRALRRAHSWLSELDRPRTPNLLGDRDIEWSWVASQIPFGPGEALDFGPGGSHLGLIAAQRGFNVTAVDLEHVHWPYLHPQLRLIRGDILRLPLPRDRFDLVINCSTVEHVGLAGRYGVVEGRPDGDLEAMARLQDLMKPGAIMLLTIPAGHDGVFAPLCRVYGKERLPRLLKGFIVEKEEFWVKDEKNRWVPCDREVALSFQASANSWDPLRNVYALGCYVLRKPS
jgi:SAM-dependent methyltransferase